MCLLICANKKQIENGSIQIHQDSGAGQQQNKWKIGAKKKEANHRTRKTNIDMERNQASNEPSPAKPMCNGSAPFWRELSSWHYIEEQCYYRNARRYEFFHFPFLGEHDCNDGVVWNVVSASSHSFNPILFTFVIFHFGRYVPCSVCCKRRRSNENEWQ